MGVGSGVSVNVGDGRIVGEGIIVGIADGVAVSTGVLVHDSVATAMASGISTTLISGDELQATMNTSKNTKRKWSKLILLRIEVLQSVIP